MKRLLSALCLLVSVGPVFAMGDEDGTVIPSYQELVREGYGPRSGDHVRVDYYSPQFIKAVPKPTQAYYGKGYTIYYGYTTVLVAANEPNTQYAFGRPLAYFRSLMPNTMDLTNLDHYAVEVRSSNFQPGEYVTQRRTNGGNAVTTVQSVTTGTKGTAAAPATNPLPPVAEKLSH